MELMAIRPYVSGYRGCLKDQGSYVFFQFTRKGGFRSLKSYPQSDFSDDLHFVAMMQKFMSASAFMVPPVKLESLSLESLAKVYKENGPRTVTQDLDR